MTCLTVVANGRSRCRGGLIATMSAACGVIRATRSEPPPLGRLYPYCNNDQFGWPERRRMSP